MVVGGSDPEVCSVIDIIDYVTGIGNWSRET